MKIEDLTKEFIQIRHFLHENAELGFKEFKTSAFIKEKLIEYGFSVINVGTSLIASMKKNTSTKKIALRADMDALLIKEENTFSYSAKGDVMHACGHDGHSASLLMAAKYLAQSNFDGTLILIFQAAEECVDENGLSGAQNLVNSKIYQDLNADFIFGYHNMPSMQMPNNKELFFLKKGVMMAGCLSYECEFIGVGGHSSQPNLCKNPINSLAKFISKINEIKLKNSVLSVVGVSSDSKAYNIISSSASCKISIRILNNDDALILQDSLKQIAKTLQDEDEITIKLNCIENIPATVNCDKAQEFAFNVVCEAFGKDKCTQNHEHLMGSEDFSSFLLKTSGAYAFINNSNSANLHTSKYDYNDDILELAAKYYISLVLKYLKP
ncbi:M20 metallopeptidase family protein [Campylobacter canadensis]|uniref:M20 metallopeptidase family protein n=1 Tax=Campylobacter canadensis TaxID=449520 RepID=UPI0015560F53|nr:amidohydrolase [Campylobacter canadensis]